MKKTQRGLRAILKIGGYYNGGSSRVFAVARAGQPETERGRSGFYLVADEVLVRWGDSIEDRHLGVFGGLTAAPDQAINRVPYFFDTGLVMYAHHQSVREISLDWQLSTAYSRGLRLAEEINPVPAMFQASDCRLHSIVKASACSGRGEFAAAIQVDPAYRNRSGI
jgi:hypothetical protein